MLAHHYLFLPGGLDDTDALLEVLVPRRQVKAYIFGHSHAWRHSTWEGIHLLNLPAVAWVFEKSQPHGWVDMTLTTAGAAVVLHAFDKKHPERRAAGAEVAERRQSVRTPGGRRGQGASRGVYPRGCVFANAGRVYNSMS